MPSTVERLLDMLHMIPRAPRKVTAAELLSKLEDEGYSVTKRTVERNLRHYVAIAHSCSINGLEAGSRSEPPLGAH